MTSKNDMYPDYTQSGSVDKFFNGASQLSNPYKSQLEWYNNQLNTQMGMQNAYVGGIANSIKGPYNSDSMNVKWAAAKQWLADRKDKSK